MAPLAIRKIIAPEGPFVVVTGRAALSASRQEMLGCGGRNDLPLLGGPGSYAVTIGAAESLQLMPGVAEIEFESLRPLRSPVITAGLVAGAARRDVAAARLGARGMALVAGLVGLQSRRDRERHAAPFRPVTGIAFRAPVARVIELHVK